MEKENIINILLVDDHAAVVEGPRRFIEQLPLRTSVRAALSGREASCLIAPAAYDLYILDIELDDDAIDGFTLVRQIKETDENACIIIMTLHDELWTVRKILFELRDSGGNKIYERSFSLSIGDKREAKVEEGTLVDVKVVISGKTEGLERFAKLVVVEQKKK